LVAAAAATAGLVAVGALAGYGGGLIHLLFFAWAVTAVLLGDAVRSRREHLATVEERARYLERTREEEARRRVVEERLRIARELHDSVAHSMATINVQAGAAEARPRSPTPTSTSSTGCWTPPGGQASRCGCRTTPGGPACPRP